MGRVIQDSTRSKIETELSGFDQGVTKATSDSATVLVTPTVIGPSRPSRLSSVARDIGIIATGVSSVINQQAEITHQTQVINQKRDLQVAQSQARVGLLTRVDQAIDSVQAASSDFDFNSEAAREASREGILNFITGPDGALISNDTLRLALDEADARIATLEPKTTVKLKEGFNIITQILDGRVETTAVPVDEDQILLNSLGAWASSHPNLAKQIADNPNTTPQQKTLQGKQITDQLAAVERSSIQTKVDNSLNPFINLPEPVRKAKAQKDYFNVFSRHSGLAIQARLTSPDFNDQVPGAMINLAAQYRADMQNIMFTDPSAAELSEMYGVDLFSLTADQTSAAITANVELLEALDTLNIQKQGAEAAVALASVASNKVRLEDAMFAQGITAGTRFIVKLAGPNAGIYRRLIRSSGRSDPAMRHLTLAMDTADSRFKAMNVSIADLADDDTPETNVEVQNILRAFTQDVTAWVDRDYISSADVVGFVSTFQQLKEKGTFQRLEPKAFTQLEALYQRAKAIPEHTNIFNKLENGEGLTQEQLSAMRETITLSSFAGEF